MFHWDRRQYAGSCLSLPRPARVARPTMALCEQGASVEVTLAWGETVRGLVYAHTPPALVLRAPRLTPALTRP